jgi:hypothetical protein
MYQWYGPKYTVVLEYVHECVLMYSSTYTCVPFVYVLIMLCHNFLIGKGHTCALRTTCVLYVPLVPLVQKVVT